MSRAVLDKLLCDELENYQILFNHRAFHNHTAHHLGALYFLGADGEKLEQVYTVVRDIVDPYEPSPHEINHSNWQDSLGDNRFCQAYKDFFEKELTTSGDEWRKKFVELLTEDSSHTMINGVVCGLLHPLIHIGYALELDSRTVAIEALTQTAVCCNQLHEISNQLQAPKLRLKSALEIFQDIHLDDRLSMEQSDIFANCQHILENFKDIILSYYDQWKLNENNLEKTIEDLFDSSVYVFGATHKTNEIKFDFFLLHLVTGMHAIRVIHTKLNDAQITKPILFQYFFLALVIYVARLRPKINKNLIDDYTIDDKKNNWNYVLDRTLNSKAVEIMHLVKMIYTLKAAEDAYGFKNGLYLKLAVKVIDHVDPDDPWIDASDNPKYLISLKQK